jgi:hypothetical protein
MAVGPALEPNIMTGSKQRNSFPFNKTVQKNRTYVIGFSGRLTSLSRNENVTRYTLTPPANPCDTSRKSDEALQAEALKVRPAQSRKDAATM